MLPLNLKNSTQMMKLWLRLVPQLSQLSPIDRTKVLDQADKASFSAAESVVMVIWLIFVYLLAKGILSETPGDSPTADAVGVNLLVTFPMLLVVFVPIYIRKISREIRKQLDAGSALKS